MRGHRWTRLGRARKSRGGWGRGKHGGAKAEPATPQLETYRAKRDANRTAEPFGGPLGDAAGEAAPRLFVIQKHAARRLHWDLRLEMGGVLRSWAVPRGVSLDPAEKRMAVETEDHPIEYVDYEGVIPDGNYGAGPMIVWDRGVYVAHIPMDEGYADGKLLFELHGHKLRGVWTLVRTAGGDGKQWLLMKKPDGGSSLAGMTEPDETSVLSGLTIEQVREGFDRAGQIRDELARLGAAKQPVEPKSVEPMLATPEAEPFAKDGWLFELKYDGYRVIAAAESHVAKLRYRSGIDATAAFPEIARTLVALPYARIVLDGEVVVLDEDAKPNFQRLQKRALLLRARDVDRAMREHPVVLYVFDLLGFEDFDLRGLPLVERKRLLKLLLPGAGAVRYADHVEREGAALFEQVRALGLEGVVGKRITSTYVAGRSPEWLKIRTEHTADFAIVGYTEPEGARVGFRALHLATWRDGGLVYVGRVGTGFDDETLARLRKELDLRLRDEPAFSGEVPSTQHRWVTPQLVAEVRFKHVTDDGLLRHPVFLRWRTDKPIEECTLERPDGAVVPAAIVETDDDEVPQEEVKLDAARRVVISNPDKVFWPDDGIVKQDLVEFYRAVSPWLLPYLRDRPLVLTRFPDGITGKSFFQKNAPPYIPSWIRTKTMWSEHAGREIEYFVCDEPESIAYVANLATIPLHVWGSRLADLQHPDWCILDLDPKGAPFPDVVRIAREIETLCAEIGMPAFLKTSGSTGLHILMPLARQCTFDQCRQLGEILARVIVGRLRDIATVERHVPSRRGRVYIDYGQNGHGRLLVAPLSVRPLPRAPVSTPLRWDELHPDLDQHTLNMSTVVARLQSVGDPMRSVLELRPDLPAILARLLPLAK
ncbi:MAG TPA: DNA ligase D [Nannocystaceae bacterium]|nr:DNA ligase D [Nannocystaceae bacterium]